MKPEEPQATSPDQLRMRVGLACLALGLACLLWAWASWFYRTSTEAERATRPRHNTPSLREVANEPATVTPYQLGATFDMGGDRARLNPTTTNTPANLPKNETGSDDA